MHKVAACVALSKNCNICSWANAVCVLTIRAGSAFLTLSLTELDCMSQNKGSKGSKGCRQAEANKQHQTATLAEFVLFHIGFCQRHRMRFVLILSCDHPWAWSMGLIEKLNRKRSFNLNDPWSILIVFISMSTRVHGFGRNTFQYFPQGTEAFQIKRWTQHLELRTELTVWDILKLCLVSSSRASRLARSRTQPRKYPRNLHQVIQNDSKRILWTSQHAAHARTLLIHLPSNYDVVCT